MSDRKLAGWEPRPRPALTVLDGRFGRLEPLTAAHSDDLWNAVRGHDALWEYMFYGPWRDGPGFARWLEERARLVDPLYWAVVDGASGRALGLATFLEIRPDRGVIEIGHLVFSPAMQRTALATEAVYLLARYAFDGLGYRRVEWKCDDRNEPSKRAALRCGFVFEGVFRNHMVVKERNRDTVWFAIIDEDWPGVRAVFEAWLSPANFDGAGRQRRRLEDARQGASKRGK
jgi:RimJ/RimL family protein N-acetyltransferase